MLIYLLQYYSCAARQVERQLLVISAVPVLTLLGYTKMHLSSLQSGEAVKFVFVRVEYNFILSSRCGKAIILYIS